MQQTAAVVEYNVTDAALAKMEGYLSLTVKGLDDKDGLKAVHNARMIVKGVRVDVEKRRKELKADALEWGRKVDSEAKRIFAKIEPIETHLTTEEEKITKEQERIKAEAERQRQETAQSRCNAMARLGMSFPFQQALTISDAEFDTILTEAQAFHDAERARIAEEQRAAAEKEEAERKAREEEAAKLAAERAEIERIRAEEDTKRKVEEAKLQAEREKLEAERRKIDEAKREQERQAELEKARKEAAEKAAQEAKERAEREAKEKAEAEERAKAEAARQEALKPDKEKLIAFAGAIPIIQFPKLNTDEARGILAEAERRLIAINRYIIKAAQGL